MECVDKRELRQFLQGELEPDRLVAVDEHVSSCTACKAALESLPVRVRTLASFGADLAGVSDCPEYEELSALVDQSLGADRARSLLAHVNMCELCARDVERIAEMRSHAAVGEKILVQPGMSARRERRAFGLWRKVLAGAAVVGVAAVVAVALREPPEEPRPARITTVRTERPEPAPVAQCPTVEKPAPPKAAPIVVTTPDKPKPVAHPRLQALLKDGRYQLVKKNSRIMMARTDGSSIRTPFEARIAALIDEKIRTGKIKQAKSVRVAMNAIYVRGPEEHVAPPTAPRPGSPVGAVIETARPLFTWSKVDLAESYRLVIMDSDGNTLAEQITESTSFKPSQPLERGRVYLWRVGARFSRNDEWASSRAAAFRVISAADAATIERVRARMPGSHLALAVVYESVGLSEGAAREYQAVRRANPGSALAGRLTATPRP